MLASFIRTLRIKSLGESLVKAFILLYKLLRLIFIASHRFSTFISLFILLFMMSVAFKRNSCSKLTVGSSDTSSALNLNCEKRFFMISLFARTLVMFAFSTSMSNGLTMYLSALVCKPLIILSLSFNAVSNMIGIWLVSILLFNILHILFPFMIGIITSDSIRSGCRSLIKSSASCPFPTSDTW